MDNRVQGFLLRGVAAGVAGGAAAALLLWVVTENQIGNALRFEDAIDVGLGPGEPAEFSRSTQELGGALATVLFGSVLGLVLGFTVAALHHRIAGGNEFQRAAKVAVAGFLAVTLIPALKYPPNPPAVGDPDTIDTRTANHLLLVAASIVVVFLAWMLWDRLTERGWDGAPRFLVAGGALVAAVTAMYLVWPATPDRVAPPDNDARPALRVADDAPPDVLGALLETARETGDVSLRDPEDPERPLDLAAVEDPQELAGAPYTISTADLVPDAFPTVVWQFRVLSIAGAALLWAVMAGTFGMLADLPSRSDRRARRAVPPAEPLGT